MKIYVATTNTGKLRDFAGAAGSEIQIVPIPGIAAIQAPEEDADTLEGNARKKAEYYSRFLPGTLILADDSGLEVDALGGAPGVYSARYAAPGKSENSSDDENNSRLLRELDAIPDSARTARFVCVLAVARDGQTLFSTRGEVEGVILREARGGNGFGYDPLFYLPELKVTTAELTAEEKALVSHRGRAFRKMLDQLARLQ